MRLLPLLPIVLLVVWMLLLPAAAFSLPDRPPTLIVPAFPQRMAARYTTTHGLPAARVTHIRVEDRTVRAQTEAGAAVFGDGRWAPAPGSVGPDHSFVEPAKLPAGVRVLSAARTPDGRIWVVTDQGLLDERTQRPAARCSALHAAHLLPDEPAAGEQRRRLLLRDD
jgi:hypothetical protein